jgi:amanitin/phalloidin family toxin
VASRMTRDETNPFRKKHLLHFVLTLRHTMVPLSTMHNIFATPRQSVDIKNMEAPFSQDLLFDQMSDINATRLPDPNSDDASPYTGSGDCVSNTLTRGER